MASYQILKQYLNCLVISLGELQTLIAAGVASAAGSIHSPIFDVVVA